MPNQSPPAFQRIRVPNTLKAKVKNVPGGQSVDALVAAGDLILAQQEEAYDGLTRADLEVLGGALALLPGAVGEDRALVLEQMLERFYAVKSQSGTFGRPLLSAVADIGCVLVSALREPGRVVPQAKPVVAALTVIVRSLELAHAEGARPLNTTTDPLLIGQLRRLVQACVTPQA
ncbi:hypothetical protein [Zavarzinia sp. CC-PAN008]|uniref:hypothetical protein n=1 Tax=Zavarzinia sp. CC-PAN008 TaxID=3243332 RepID=UPI003F746585